MKISGWIIKVDGVEYHRVFRDNGIEWLYASGREVSEELSMELEERFDEMEYEDIGEQFLEWLKGNGYET